jgi:hypothetical protein
MHWEHIFTPYWNKFFSLALQPLWALPSFQSPDLFTIGGIPWTSDQLIIRPLPKHRTVQTQIKHIYTPNIHALSGIRTHDHSVRTSEESSCLRPLRYSDRHWYTYVFQKLFSTFCLFIQIMYLKMHSFYSPYSKELRDVYKLLSIRRR